MVVVVVGAVGGPLWPMWVLLTALGGFVEGGGAGLVGGVLLEEVELFAGGTVLLLTGLLSLGGLG